MKKFTELQKHFTNGEIRPSGIYLDLNSIIGFGAETKVGFQGNTHYYLLIYTTGGEISVYFSMMQDLEYTRNVIIDIINNWDGA